MPIFQRVCVLLEYQSVGGLPPDVPEFPNQLWKVQYTGNATDGAPVTCSEAATGEQTTTDQEWKFIKIGANGCYKVRNVASQSRRRMEPKSRVGGDSLTGTRTSFGLSIRPVPPTPERLGGNQWQPGGECMRGSSYNAMDLSLLVLNRNKKKTEGLVVYGRVVLDSLRLQLVKYLKHFECEDCTQDRISRKCPNPRSCATAAQKRLGEILPKWDPQTPDTYKVFEQAGDSESSVTFQDFDQIQTLAERFRIFTKQDKDHNDLPVANAPALAHQAPDRRPVTVYGGTASQRGGDADAKAGIGIFYSENDPRNLAIKIPDEIDQSISAAEIAAAIIAARGTDPNTPLMMESNRNVLLKCIGKCPIWEDNGWVNIRNGGELQALLSILRARQASATFTESKGTQ
ncbi:hypothetical protein B0H19DRAFT_1066884 [Mycena capillaripes]|nr:hypothetical protein B0H19DRAFT_1066884 [Mycena capillaripes]